ncbi:glucose 1-dehydrogenase [Chloroflexota bacterium]
MGALDGKVALVTGAARGLGRVSSRMFAREGARVVVVDISRDTGEETVRLIKNTGGEAIFVAADVSSSSDVQAMVQAAVDTYGGLDCALNSAAIDVGRHHLAEIPEEEWHRSTAVNLTGVFLCMKYEIQAMLERGGGAIVNVGSGPGNLGVPGAAWYIAAKNGLYGLTKTAAVEYGSRGIRVNALGPGTMWTPMMREAAEKSPQHVEAMKKMSPVERIAEPEEMAEAAVWLCTPAASYVIGHTLVVDGGATAGVMGFKR